MHLPYISLAWEKHDLQKEIEKKKITIILVIFSPIMFFSLEDQWGAVSKMVTTVGCHLRRISSQAATCVILVNESNMMQ